MRALVRFVSCAGSCVGLAAALSGCIESTHPIGDRDKLSEKHPLVGYWIGGAEDPADGNGDIISVLYTGDPERLTVVAAPNAVTAAEIEAMKQSASDDIEVYDVYPSRSRAQLGIYRKKGFVSVKRLKGKRDEFDLMAYRIHPDGTLTMLTGDKKRLSEAQKAGQLKEAEYDPVHSRILANPDRLADFVNAFDGFIEGSVFRRAGGPGDAEKINASERRLEDFFVRNDFERKMIFVRLNDERFERRASILEDAGRVDVGIDFENPEDEIYFEIRRWEGSKGQFAGRTVADLIASGGAAEWMADLAAKNGVERPQWKSASVGPKQPVLEVVGMGEGGGYGPAEPVFRAVAFDTEFGVCLVSADWPEYATDGLLQELFEELAGQL